MIKFFSPLRKFLKVPFVEKILFIEAVISLFFAKVLLLIFSFKFCIHITRSKNYSNNNTDPEYLQSIKTAVHRANQLAFWKNVCLVQSLAGRWMLKRRKIASRLSLGVAHGEKNEIIAHAWLKINDFEITTKGLFYKELIEFK